MPNNKTPKIIRLTEELLPAAKQELFARGIIISCEIGYENENGDVVVATLKGEEAETFMEYMVSRDNEDDRKFFNRALERTLKGLEP
jgi:hypothetical protein